MLGGAPSRRRAFVGMGCRASCCAYYCSRRWCQPDVRPSARAQCILIGGHRRSESRVHPAGGQSSLPDQPGVPVSGGMAPGIDAFRLHGVGIQTGRGQAEPKSPDCPAAGQNKLKFELGAKATPACSTDRCASLCVCEAVGDPQAAGRLASAAAVAAAVRRAARARVNRGGHVRQRGSLHLLAPQNPFVHLQRWTGISGGTSKPNLTTSPSTRMTLTVILPSMIYIHSLCETNKHNS